MFRSKDDEQSSISVFVEKKARMLKSKVDYALHGDHVHYFSKKQSLDPFHNFQRYETAKVAWIYLMELKLNH